MTLGTSFDTCRQQYWMLMSFDMICHMWSVSIFFFYVTATFQNRLNSFFFAKRHLKDSHVQSTQFNTGGHQLSHISTSRMIQLKLDAPDLNFELHGKGCGSCSFNKFAQISKSQKTPLPLWGEVKWSEVLRIHLYVAQTAFRNDFKHNILTQS